jgi:predicted DNA-binding transcriptional regulator AlpA
MKEVYISDVELGERYSVHRMTIWRWLKSDPYFPKPLKLSGGCSRWKLSEIDQWETTLRKRSSPSK